MNNDIDDYDVDDDPFAESGGEDASAQNNNAQSKKRKDATGLGIDEEVAVAKKIRAPAVKLDETRYTFNCHITPCQYVLILIITYLDCYQKRVFQDSGARHGT